MIANLSLQTDIFACLASAMLAGIFVQLACWAGDAPEPWCTRLERLGFSAAALLGLTAIAWVFIAAYPAGPHRLPAIFSVIIYLEIGWVFELFRRRVAELREDRRADRWGSAIIGGEGC